jgi:hypothetical protein
MTFHTPIDDAQWQVGKSAYKGFRFNIKTLRFNYPPKTKDELRLLRQYTAIVQQFGQELLKPRGKISAARLNDLRYDAVQTFVAYLESSNEIE